MLIMIVLMIVMMFFIQRSGKKRQNQIASFRDSLRLGQEVMTGSGYVGTIVAIDDERVTLESTPGNRSVWVKAAIAKLTETSLEEQLASTASPDSTVNRDNPFEVPDTIEKLISKPTDNDKK